MARNDGTQNTTLMELPSELRVEVMRYLLVFPRAPALRITDPDYFPCTVCNECDLVARKRDETRGPIQIHTSILLVCRILYADALKALNENKMVAVHEPRTTSKSSLRTLRLGHWRARAGARPSVQPIISFKLSDYNLLIPSPVQQSYSMYLFDLRDLNLLVRYLLHYARTFTAGMAIDVCLETLQVPDVCHSGNAVDRLFLSPVWPCLNGELRTIAYGTATIDLSTLTVRYAPPESNKPDSQAKAVGKVINAFVSSTEASATSSQQRWNVHAAEEIWQRRQETLDGLATIGTWTLSVPWEIVCHENLHSLRDQLEYQENTSSPTSHPETPATIMAHLMLFLFTSAIIYMNVAYTKGCRNYLEQSECKLMQRAAGCLDHVRHYLSSAPDATADCLYVYIPIIEVWARINRVRHAWYHLYRMLLNVQPSFPPAMWVKTQFKTAQQEKKHYLRALGKGDEDAGRQQWIKSGSSRALFFRRLCKNWFVPLVIAKYGDTEGAFFREILVEDVGTWVKSYESRRK